MRTISAILASRGPVFNTIDAGATVLEALGLMQCENLNYVVVTRYNRYAGLFTETDYARRVILQNRHSHHTPVGDIMTVNLPCVSGNDTAGDALLLMNLYQTRCLPVFDEFEFKGVIAVNELLQDMLDEQIPAAPKESVLPLLQPGAVRRRHQIH
jgi:IMP dehydrogenase